MLEKVKAMMDRDPLLKKKLHPLILLS